MDSGEFFQRGFIVEPGVLSRELIEALNDLFASSAYHRYASNWGGLVPLDVARPSIVSVLTHARPLEILADLGYDHPMLHSFHATIKHGNSASLPWHSDQHYYWPHPKPSEIFVIYYLHDTTPENGCLRVVPGSHRRPWSPDDGRSNVMNLQTGLKAGEIDVSMRAGDMFMGDRRLLHATHPNNKSSSRIGITVSYVTYFEELHRGLQNMVMGNRCLPRANLRVHPDLAALLPPRV